MAVKQKVEPQPAETSMAESGFATGAVRDLSRTQLVGAAAREQSEIQASMAIALQFPRNDLQAYSNVMTSCDRTTFAGGALYRYPRAGQQIEGPSVKMAREAARLWGNLRYGARVTDRTEKYTTVEGFCHDLQTNSFNTASLTFENKIFRKSTGWITPDERDYRELVMKNSAIVTRNAILQVLPPDLVEDAMSRCKETTRKAAAGDIKKDKSRWLKSMTVALSEFGVTVAMIEENLGHEMQFITSEEAADLKGTYNALKDGQAKVSDFFKTTKKKEKAGPSSIDEVVAEAEKK